MNEKVILIIFALLVLISLGQGPKEPPTRPETEDAKIDQKAAEDVAALAEAQSKAILENCLRSAGYDQRLIQECHQFGQPRPGPISRSNEVPQNLQIVMTPPADVPDEKVLCTGSNDVHSGSGSTERQKSCLEN